MKAGCCCSARLCAIFEWYNFSVYIVLRVNLFFCFFSVFRFLYFCIVIIFFFFWRGSVNNHQLVIGVFAIHISFFLFFCFFLFLS